MKKHILFATFFLTVLISLNGCTLFTTYKVIDNDNLLQEKEVFATKEIQNDEKSVQDVNDSHKFAVETDEGEITFSDGTVLARYSYSYPVFECNKGDNEAYVATINKMLKNNAAELVSEAMLEKEALYKLYEDSKHNSYWFSPYDYKYDYEIHTDAKGIISITEIWYYYMGGAHGGTLKESHTFDVVNGKKFLLSDLLYGTDEEITKAYTQKFLEIRQAFFDDPCEVVPAELPKAQYYVDSQGVTAYFQQYQVGSYAAGFVSATISDKEMLKFDFSDTY